MLARSRLQVKNIVLLPNLGRLSLCPYVVTTSARAPCPSRCRHS